MSHAIGIYNGYLFDYLDPDPALIDLDTIAVVLGRTPRFGGHTTRVVTTAEHCLRVGRIARDIALGMVAASGVRPVFTLDRVQLHALLHDAHEVYTPWGDCLAPGKTDYMREVEAQVDDAIFQCLALDDPTDDMVRTFVSLADKLSSTIASAKTRGRL